MKLKLTKTLLLAGAILGVCLQNSNAVLYGSFNVDGSDGLSEAQLRISSKPFSRIENRTHNAVQVSLAFTLGGVFTLDLRMYQMTEEIIIPAGKAVLVTLNNDPSYSIVGVTDTISGTSYNGQEDLYCNAQPLRNVIFTKKYPKHREDPDNTFMDTVWIQLNSK